MSGLGMLRELGGLYRGLAKRSSAYKLGRNAEREALPLRVPKNTTEETVARRYADPERPLMIQRPVKHAVRVTSPNEGRIDKGGSGRKLKKAPEMDYERTYTESAYEPDEEGVDPYDLRPTVTVDAMRAGAENPDTVPRMYYTLWDLMEQEGLFDRNIAGGLTGANMTRKPPYLMSYMLRKDRATPHVELHPNYMGAADYYDPDNGDVFWKWADHRMDEQRYPELRTLRRGALESYMTDEERDVSSMLGSYARGWDDLDFREQLGALALGDAGRVSTKFNAILRDPMFDRARWPVDNPLYEDTLAEPAAAIKLGSYGIGPASHKRALLSDWAIRRLREGKTIEGALEDPRAEEFFRGALYKRGGRVQGGLRQCSCGGRP